jgi:anaerobic selenocysteine-containing dehydrogenase
MKPNDNGATSKVEVKHTFCRLCEVMCGLVVTVTDGEITKVRADADHPVSKGFACSKGLVALDVHQDPDRLNHPLRKVGTEWEQVSWPDATADIAVHPMADLARTDHLLMIGAEINVVLRTIDDTAWPFKRGVRLVGPLTAALDMLGDPVDDRSIESARPIVERYL